MTDSNDDVFRTDRRAGRADRHERAEHRSDAPTQIAYPGR